MRNMTLKHGGATNMVNRSTFSMVSALAGLQRLESQIHRALMETGVARQQPGESAESIAQQVKEQAEKHMARASLALNDVDLMA